MPAMPIAESSAPMVVGMRQTSSATSAPGHFSTGPVDLIDGFLNGGLSGNSAHGNGADGDGAHGNGATGNGVTGNGTSIAPKLDRSLTSDIGDVASGNAVGNGNNAVVGSGNDVSALVNAPVSPTVTAPVTAPVDGADVGSNVGDTNSSVKDLVDSTLGDSLDLGTTLGR